MKTLIVGRTKMGGMRCIGGLCEDGRSIRLLDAQGNNWYPSTTFAVGQEWDLTFSAATDVRAPHVEDVIVKSSTSKCIGTVSDVRGAILARIQAWQGSTSKLFDGAVEYTGNHNGYIEGKVPDRSTWFWIPDKDLVLRDNGTHYDYTSTFFGITIQEGMKYVGEQTAPKRIPAGSLVRVSLARWWRPDDDESFPERCYLQLSGWY